MQVQWGDDHLWPCERARRFLIGTWLSHWIDVDIPGHFLYLSIPFRFLFFFWAFMCYSLCNYFLKATLWEEHSAFSLIHSFQQVFLHRLSHWKLNSSFKACEQVSLPALLSCYSISLDILQSQSHLVMSRYYNKICNI